jgi:hypothetical protein
MVVIFSGSLFTGKTAFNLLKEKPCYFGPSSAAQIRHDQHEEVFAQAEVPLPEITQAPTKPTFRKCLET